MKANNILLVLVCIIPFCLLLMAVSSLITGMRMTSEGINIIGDLLKIIAGGVIALLGNKFKTK